MSDDAGAGIENAREMATAMRSDPAYMIKYRRSPKGKAARRRAHLKDKYGITDKEYDAMFVAQGGACAICRRVEKEQHPLAPGKPQRLTVDHDHLTDRVRGLLCACCNRAIGQIFDNPGTARAMAEYLER
jgi:hypothetical protein